VNVQTLADSVLRKLEAHGYAVSTLRNFKRAYSVTTKWFQSETEGIYSIDSQKRYVEYLQARLSAGELGRDWYNIIIRCLSRLRSFYENSTTDCGYDRCGHREYAPSTEAVDIVDAALSATQLSYEFKRKLDSIMRKFFCFTEEAGIAPLGITHQTMVSFVHRCHDDGIMEKYCVVRSLKVLADYYVSIGKMTSAPAFGFIVPKQIKGKLIPAFTEDEVLAIFGAIDRVTPVGKRNFAIILLALGTGLRAGDIAKLKRRDFDYKAKTVAIVQSKTGKPLTVAISGQICNAVSDYLLNGRPRTDSDNVFIRACAPYKAINPSAISNMMSKVCVRAGIEKKPYRNFHSLRRTFGVWLASGGVSVLTISQMFGHTELNSSRRYLPFQDDEISQCAMDFSGIPIQGGVYCDLS